MKTFRIPVVKSYYGFILVDAKDEDSAINLIKELDDEDIDAMSDMDVTDTSVEVLIDEIEEDFLSRHR